ncbi:MAG: hypothetical protein N2376_07625 [Clostridia bacterium]|nr:hypothetical protein [Clostridia bacterium]
MDNLFWLVIYLFTGVITLQVLTLSLFIAPAVVAGMWLGVKVDRRLNEKTVRMTIIVLLIVSGCV